MLAFYRAYPDAPIRHFAAACGKIDTIRKSAAAAAQLPDAILWSIPWFHHIVLMEKVKDRTTRLWYMRQTLDQRLEPQHSAR